MEFQARDLRLLVGEGEIRNDVAHVNRYQNGFALASSGPISIDASNLSILNYSLESSNPKPPSFFWRSASNPGDIEIIDIESNLGGILSLSDHPSWKGTVTEIGVTFYGAKGQSAQIRRLSLQPDSLLTNVSALWSGWSAYEPWTQTSVNWLSGGPTGLKIPLPLLPHSRLQSAQPPTEKPAAGD